jgi:hypothetical protein
MTLPGPSRRIIVVPLEEPAEPRRAPERPEPLEPPDPDPAREPAPDRGPEREGEPVP